MKKNRRQILVLAILGAALLGNQIGLHFLHDSHKAHEYFSATAKDQTILLKHGEHCEVCSIDFLFHVVLPVTTEVPNRIEVRHFAEATVAQTVVVFTALAQGRAPPAQS